VTLNYKQGLFRFWIVASVVWLAVMATLYGDAGAVGSYLGHQYHLYGRSPLSWKAALERERLTEARSQSCRQAHEQSCEHRSDAAYAQCIRSQASPQNEYDCLLPVCDRDAYLRNAKALFIAAGDLPENLTAELCDGLRLIEVPRVNWAWIGGAVLPIFLPLILWFICVWIARCFVGAKRRAERG